MLAKSALSFIFAAAALSAAAADGSMTYSYANDELNIWGKGKSEIYDVAVRISDPALVGKKITSIRAVLNACEGIESTSLWLTKELVLDKIDGDKVTVPDTYSATVAPEPVYIPGKGDEEFGQLSVKLDTPYELTEEGIYVGYSLTVPSVPKGESLSRKQQYPVVISPSKNPESLYLRLSKDFLKWVSYNETIHAAAAIYVTLEGDFAEYCVGLDSMSKAYAPAGEDFTVKAELSNTSGAPVRTLGYSYKIDGKVFDRTIELNPPVEPDLFNSKSVALPIDGISELGEYRLDLTLTTVNGGANISPDASASSMVSVVPFVPVHRPMLEEFTGTWCGWCPRGYYALEKLNELYGDGIVLAAYHIDDTMGVTRIPVAIESNPSATLNREGVQDPYYGWGTEGFGMKKEVVASMDSLAIADINASAVWADDARTSISVKATCTFIESMENAGYKVGYLLLNNGLTGTGPSWFQENYFSTYASDFIGTELQELTYWPAKVPGLVYNDVVVDTSGMMGVDESLPADIAFNVGYENEFAFDIASNGVIQDKDKLYVAAFIINPDGTILNSIKVKVDGSDAAVDNIESDLEEVAVEYYSPSGMRVRNPRGGVFVKVARMADGGIRTSKIAVK